MTMETSIFLWQMRMEAIFCILIRDRDIFKDITEESGLKSNGGSGAVAVGDYNNDGFSDLFITSVNGGKHEFTGIKATAVLNLKRTTRSMFSVIQNVRVYDARFFDFDNDGFLDLIIAGESEEKGGRGFSFS